MEDVDELVAELRLEGIKNEAVLAAIAATPRHLFVTAETSHLAYTNHALPIDSGQTISQPYVVAKMTELLLENSHINKVLEIGTGSGYQAAVLAKVANEVYTIERIQHLYEQAKNLLQELDYKNVHIIYADGNKGGEDNAPFDAIIVTAATNAVPQALLDQLAIGGRLVIPVGGGLGQQIQVQTKQADAKFQIDNYDPVIFVPMLPGTE